MVEGSASLPGLPESSDSAHRAALLGVIEQLRKDQRECTQRAIRSIEPALDACLGSLPAYTLEQGRELAKSLGEILREFGLSARGKGLDSDRPCFLTVDYDPFYPGLPRYRLQFKGATKQRYSLVEGRTYTKNVRELLPFSLMPAPPRIQRGFVRWADRSVDDGDAPPLGR